MNIRVKDGSTGMGALTGYRLSLSMPKPTFSIHFWGLVDV